MRILIVEDNKNIAAYTSALLTQNSYEVVVALDGRLGMDELKRNSFDLVLLDLNLPDINGIEILQFIRTSTGFTELPVIILSGESNDDIIDSTFELGANDFIRKPFKDRNLLLRVEKHLHVQKLTKQLRSNEERMRQITENMTDMAYTIDLNLNITYISPSVEKILGFTVDEYMGFPVHERYTQSTIATVKAILKDEMAHDSKPGIDKDRTRIIECKGD